ncbi:hypothetical protein VSH64_14465 [Amycolatopsis rhabdoformis]|uniref:Uncharacterized protein n=1 Tax=Amycolatopsis rhabdoformis TaxID=1448059 RepID=A0ABZ1II09_9PSEU|nr:hypothetical protein [Amycolatopsis rhabdoformis]WSE33303.1 hypothetical protein VSH64_14465 [Amycolatopsis rhabdoformis]
MAERALCLEPLELSGRERSVLRSVAVRGARSSLYCELEAGHGQEHVAGVRGDTGEGAGGPRWWLRWWPGRRVLEARAECGAPDGEGAVCRVPGGHEGGHPADRLEAELAEQGLADPAHSAGPR